MLAMPRVIAPGFDCADADADPEPPQPPTTTEIRRKRKVLSCRECRRSKLKCDRESPACSRCRKAGRADSCTYDEDSGRHERPPKKRPENETEKQRLDWAFPNPLTQDRGAQSSRQSSGIDPSQPSGTWQLKGNVSSLSKVGILRPASNSPQPSPRPTTPPETMIFRGKNFMTQFYGSTNPTSLIAHVSIPGNLLYIQAKNLQFPELRSFMKESITQHPSLPRVQRELKLLQVRWKRDKCRVVPSSDADIVHLLPSQDALDHYISLYFDTFETMYRILHRHSFWSEYRMFLEDRRAAKPAFVVTLLLIIASVSCLSLKEQPSYIGDSSVARERATTYVEVADWWLRRQSQKNIYLAIWQVKCLSLLAKQANILKKKRTWTTAGTLVREAMAAGFHRDPSLLGEKVSVFDQEIRRRLWSTMVELELQASIDRGMPSALAGVSFDSAPVLNINDDDLVLDGNSPPVSRPWAEFTDCSFLHMSRATLQLRVYLNSVANDLSAETTYEDAMNHEELITKELRRLPQVADARETGDQPSMSLMARVLLDVQLRQFFLFLHAPFARQAESNVRYSLSRVICLNSAAQIIENYSKLNSTENFLLLLFRHDYFRAALVLCHTMCISISIKSRCRSLRFCNRYLPCCNMTDTHPRRFPVELEPKFLRRIRRERARNAGGQSDPPRHRFHALLVHIRGLRPPPDGYRAGRGRRAEAGGHRRSRAAVLPRAGGPGQHEQGQRQVPPRRRTRGAHSKLFNSILDCT